MLKNQMNLMKLQNTYNKRNFVKVGLVVIVTWFRSGIETGRITLDVYKLINTIESSKITVLMKELQEYTNNDRISEPEPTDYEYENGHMIFYSFECDMSDNNTDICDYECHKKQDKCKRETNFLCIFCKVSQPSKSALTKHMDTHMVCGILKCTYCRRDYTRSSSLLRHLRVHIGEMPYNCNYCKKRFSEKWILVRHIRMHTGEKPFQCNYCKKQFTQKSTLVRHKRTHTGDLPYQCLYCEEQFALKGALMRHVVVHGNKEDLFTCYYCGKEFNGKVYLYRHITVHTGDTAFRCYYCEEQLGDEPSFDEHIKLHIGKGFGQT